VLDVVALREIVWKVVEAVKQRKRLFLAITVFALSVYMAAAARPVAAFNWQQEAKNALEWVADWLNKYVFTPIGKGLSDALQGLTSTVIGFFSSIIDALRGLLYAPIDAVQKAWANAVTSLQNLLGPFAFLSPLILVGLAIAAIMIVLWALREISPLPGI